MRTIPERVAALETQFITVVAKMEKQVDEMNKSLNKFTSFMSTAEAEIERIAAKKVNDHYNEMERLANANIFWRKKGVIISLIVGILGQWAILLWILEKVNK